VKSLARQTEDAISNVSAQAHAIAGTTSSVATGVETVVSQIRAVDGIASEVAAATDQQREATAEIMRNITLVAEHTQTVSDQVRTLIGQAEETDQSARHFGRLAGGIAADMNLLNQRLSVIMRASPAVSRRTEARVVVGLHWTAGPGPLSGSGHTADLSPRGSLLVMAAKPELVGQTIPVTFDRIGTLKCQVRGVSKLGIHTAFVAVSASQTEAIASVLRETNAADVGYVARCQAVAAAVAGQFEQALQSGRISETALFDTDHREIEGTDPRQHLSDATELCEAVLPAIIDPAKDADPHIVFCLACDRVGYIAAHNLTYSKPQRPGDPVWNAANCRNRRIFDDRAAMLAARSTQPFLIQIYQRDMGGGQFVVLKEYDAPVTVRGRHWGGVRLTVKL